MRRSRFGAYKKEEEEEQVEEEVKEEVKKKGGERIGARNRDWIAETLLARARGGERHRSLYRVFSLMLHSVAVALLLGKFLPVRPVNFFFFFL